MKTKIYSVAVLLTLHSFYNRTNAQANQQLSNLTPPTAVNASLFPGIDNLRNLGSVVKSWKNIYLGGSVYLGGVRFLAEQTGTGAGNTAVGSAVLNANTTGSSNTGVGLNALYSNSAGTENTATGYHALYANTTGHANNAFGVSTLAANTTGGYNTAIGDYTMSNNSTGVANTAVGVYSLNANTTGGSNTVTGVGVLSFNTTGSNNVAYGNNAMTRNIRGNSNVAVGIRALYNNENGSNMVAVGDSALLNVNSYQCTAVGSWAGMNNTTGSRNTYLGYHAGITVTAGTSNTLIGCAADVSSSTIINATAIGNEAVVNESNRVRIGNSSVTSIGGQVGWTNFSDERIKNDIQENVPGLKFINQLRPVTYHYDIDKEEKLLQIKDADNSNGKYDIGKIQFTGFLAQEVEAAAKKIDYNFSGVDAPKNENDLYGLRYAEFVVPLVKAVQELSKMNDEKDAKINDLESRLEKLEALMNVPQTSTVKLETSNIGLEQNIPNPFNHTTTINYTLPQQYSSAKIIITNKLGKTLKEITVSGAGKGSLNVDASTLSSGAYQYALYVDGKMIGEKQMMLAK